MFIIVGCYVAPKYKFVIGIFLAIAVCGSVVFTFIIRSDMPLWDIIVCDIFSLLGAFAGGAGAKAFEDQEKRLNGSFVEEKEVILDYRSKKDIAESARVWKQMQEMQNK
jgi:hypothetical protein